MATIKVSEHTRALREAGFAVCVFAPHELKGVPAKHIEDALCELGNKTIELLKEKH